jgi:predicted oxidoreductase
MSTRRDFLTQSAAAGLLVAASADVTQVLASNNSAGSVTPMKSYSLPQTDLVVSRLAFGCAMLGADSNSDDFIPKTEAVIHAAFDSGITLFDLADSYAFGRSEMALGQVLAQSPGMRHKVVIQSKCADVGSGWVKDNSRSHIVESVEGSLRRLGTDHLDILLLHWPDSLAEPEEISAAFDGLLRAGKVRHFGVSNHSPYQIELLKKHVRQPLIINQIQLGLAHWYVIPTGAKTAYTHGSEGVVNLDFCRAQGIRVQAYSPLKGDDFGASPSLLNPPSDASPEVKKAAQLLTDLARQYDATPAAVMLAWLLRHPAGIIPIVGATRPEHVVQSSVADRINLTREEWYSLLAASASISTNSNATGANIKAS